MDSGNSQTVVNDCMICIHFLMVFLQEAKHQKQLVYRASAGFFMHKPGILIHTKFDLGLLNSHFMSNYCFSER